MFTTRSQQDADQNDFDAFRSLVPSTCVCQLQGTRKSAMSNILKIFQQGKQNDATKPPEEECLGCLMTAAGVMTLGGLYLSSGLVFNNGGKPLPNVTPNYRAIVRISGGAVFLFGVYRGYEAYQFYRTKGWGGFQ